MSSVFDTEVRERREAATPWARIDFESFVRSVGMYDTPEPGESADAGHAVLFTAQYRPSVASRMWYTLEWTGEGGERHRVSSQYFDLLLWRAAHVEAKLRGRTAKDAGQVESTVGERAA